MKKETDSIQDTYDAMNEGSTLFLFLYTAFGALGVYLAYLVGMYVESISGPQVSLLLFLSLFVLALVAAFPIAMRIAVSAAKRKVRRKKHVKTSP